MSMGLGKTFTAVKADERLQSKKTIWVTDDERLLEQSAMAFIRDKFDQRFSDEVEKLGFINYCKQGGVFAGTGYRMSVVKADLFDTSGDVVFCSAQTLWRRLDKLDPNLFDVMFIDEAHCFGAKTLYQGISHFNPRVKIGLTGSPYRNDGMMMGDIFDKIVYEYGMGDGIKDGWLCELNGIRIKTNVSLDKVHTIGGDFNKEELSNEINTLARNNLIADSYINYALGRQFIGFGVDINHCMALAEAFQQKGINCSAVSSDEERTGDKNVKIKAYRAGKIDGLFSVNLFQKGFDHPNTGCSIAAAPTKSLVRYLQGPAGRPSRLKDEAYVKKFGQNAIKLDICDSTSRHNLINCWELDKQKPPEERTFITKENREKLIADREAKKAKLEHTRKEDEIVQLLAIPKFKYNKRIGNTIPASVPQLKWISDLGYDVENISFTHAMCSEIISSLPATPKQISWMRYNKFDVNSKTVITRGEAEMARKIIEKKQAKAEAK